ncbi:MULTISPECIES: peroxidase [Klebsiella]|uniref:peroxidase n=1 Tax=Klebsiella TaxID=570 RepID=UPI001112DCAD|nr:MULTISPECIES: peroxidase [Klebsiella]BBR57793.1 hypothetical protein WP4W18E05_11610 [Klebsiella sp. WP4-W18-ESBL-05]
MKNLQPWDLNPSLKKEHLITTAKFISEVRNSIVDLHDEDIGDTNQSLGFRAYECCRSRLNRAALVEKKWPFLSIISKSRRYTFAINGTPVRFYKGTPSTPEERRLIPCAEAVKQMSFIELEEPQHKDIIWFFVVEVDQFKYTESVTFVGYLNGLQVSSYEIPLDGLVPLLSSVPSTENNGTPEAVTLPKPKVSAKKAKPDSDSPDSVVNDE